MLSGDRLPRKKQMEDCEKCCPPNAGKIKQRSSGQRHKKIFEETKRCHDEAMAEIE